MSSSNIDQLRQQENGGPQYAVPALEKGLDILECLAAHGSAMTQSQIARTLDRGSSELFRMLTCLERRGYLYRDSFSGAYGLTLRLYELSRTHSPYQTLLRMAEGPMRELVLQTQQSCHLSVLHAQQLLVLAQEESTAPLRLSVAVGGAFSPVDTASGRLILAYRSQEDINLVLTAQPDNAAWSDVQRAHFDERLKHIHAQGFEAVSGETIAGVCDLSVLVGTPTSQVQAALTLTALTHNSSTFFEQALPHIQACAQTITHLAGLAAPMPSVSE